ncbi:MAG: inositol-3-phosphate synthase [Anaerolineae bacterium]|nr:inositol-3-phosphate synthase [Anaerolineae bacterium]MDW8172861.1 inositol-3-phosphate synthase [Anaerolineae bacterium]
MSKRIRVAVVGVGNCASSLIQGVHFYANAQDDDFVPGLMHVRLGDYHVSDLEFVAAFDVDADKVGQDLSVALHSGQNNTPIFAQVPWLGVTVQRGPTLDGLGTYLAQKIKESSEPVADVVQVLRDQRVDVLVSYLPVGSQKATEFYADCALQAKVAFVNAIPVFIGSNPVWQAKFEAAGLPVLGDDVKSQVGATIVHRVLANLFKTRGVKLERTSQLNVGGNMDFYNMLDRSRLESKKISKTNAVVSQLDEAPDPENVYIGPSDYVPWLQDRKWAHIRLEGRSFGDQPLTLELKLEVVDSPNSAGVMIDAIRCAKIALDRGLAGAIEAPSSYFFKTPPIQPEDNESRLMLEAFIADESYVWRGLERTRGTAAHKVME